MAMNLLQVVDRLKDLSDPEIKNMMQQPSGEVPTWAVYNEAVRRQRLRAEASSPPKTTVGDDLEATIQPTPQPVGIGALAQQMRPQQQIPQQMPQGMPPQQMPGMAHGGPIRMQSGGVMGVGQTEFDWIAPLVAQLKSEGVPEWQINSIIAQQERAKKEAQFRGQPPIIPGGIVNPSIPNQPGPVQDVAAHTSPPAEQPWSEYTDPTPPVPSPQSGGPGIETPGIKIPPSIPPAVERARNVPQAAPGTQNVRPAADPAADSDWASERSAINDLIGMVTKGRESKEEKKNDILWRNMLLTGLNIMAAGAKTGSALGAIGAGGAIGIQGLVKELQDLDKQDRESIMDELKARTLKLDSLYREKAIDAQMYGHQISREVGLARANAAARGASGAKNLSYIRLRQDALEKALRNPAITFMGKTPEQARMMKAEMVKELAQLKTASESALGFSGLEE